MRGTADWILRVGVPVGKRGKFLADGAQIAAKRIVAKARRILKQ